jgi:hypothetical protein
MARDRFTAFLYGVNIPGGVWLKAAQVEVTLTRDLPGIRYAKCIGDADNSSWK